MIKRRRGFTLIEMTIVLFIISLLVLIILPNLNGQRRHAQHIHGGAMLTVVQGQVTAYLDDHGGAKTVSFQELKAAKYLTSQQVTQAKREGIHIKDDQAIHESK